LQRLLLPQSVLWLCRAVFYHKDVTPKENGVIEYNENQILES